MCIVVDSIYGLPAFCKDGLQISISYAICMKGDLCE